MRFQKAKVKAPLILCSILPATTIKRRKRVKFRTYHPKLERRFHDGNQCAPGQATSFIFMVKWALYNKTWNPWLLVIPEGLLCLQLQACFGSEPKLSGFSEKFRYKLEYCLDLFNPTQHASIRDMCNQGRSY